jgi:hypothetical protein
VMVIGRSCGHRAQGLRSVSVHAGPNRAAARWTQKEETQALARIGRNHPKGSSRSDHGRVNALDSAGIYGRPVRPWLLPGWHKHHTLVHFRFSKASIHSRARSCASAIWAGVICGAILVNGSRATMSFPALDPAAMLYHVYAST